MKKRRNIGVNELMEAKWEYIPLSQEWIDHFGRLFKGFRIHIKGNPKNGKTEYLIRLIKELALASGKVHLNSTEQGKSPTLQEAFVRNKMNEVKGKVMLAAADQKDFDNWYAKLTQPRAIIGNTIVLDSADYMNLTVAQYKQLNDRFKHKNIIIVSWAINPINKSLAHMMDVIVDVKDFVANPVSRMGGNKPYEIWSKRDRRQAQIPLFN